MGQQIFLFATMLRKLLTISILWWCKSFDRFSFMTMMVHCWANYTTLSVLL